MGSLFEFINGEEPDERVAITPLKENNETEEGFLSTTVTTIIWLTSSLVDALRGKK